MIDWLRKELATWTLVEKWVYALLCAYLVVSACTRGAV